MSSVFQLIADKPQVQLKIKQEADQFFKNEEIYENMANLRYTEAVIKETLRLMPTVPISGRYCVKATNILGYEVKAGVIVYR